MSNRSRLLKFGITGVKRGLDRLPAWILWEAMSFSRVNLPDITDEGEKTQGGEYMEDIVDAAREYRGGFDLSDATVLDIGCGPGRVLVPFTRGGAEGYGIDISRLNLKKCEQYAEWAGTSVTVAKTNDRIPFDREFDLIFSINAFMRMNRPTMISYLVSAYDCLRPNGVVYFHFRNLLNDETIDRVLEECREKQHTFRVRYHTRSEVEAYLDGIGYERIECYEDGNDLVALASKHDSERR